MTYINDKMPEIIPTELYIETSSAVSLIVRITLNEGYFHYSIVPEVINRLFKFCGTVSVPGFQYCD